MEYSTLKPWQEIGETGIIYAKGSLYGRFHELADPRHAKGKRYSLVTLLTIIFLGKICGKDKPEEIADWGKNMADELAKLLGLKRSWMPSHSTIRRVFNSILDEEEFNQMAERYHQQENGEGGKHLAMDGKTLRGTRIAGVERSDHVLNVYDIETHRVVAQEAVDIKENEIVAAPKALSRISIAGKIISGDAMHTQREVSQQIIDANGHYIWPVKENQSRMYEDIQRLFAEDTPQPGFGKITVDFQSDYQTSYGHSRFEKRIIQTSTMLNEYIGFPGVQQVYRLERNFFWVRKQQVYKQSKQVEFGITSLPRDICSPASLLCSRREHWFIETGLHYCRDVTFHEDATRMTIGSAGRILAITHNLVIGLLKQAGFRNTAKARRFFEGHLLDAFSLLCSANSLS